MEGVKIDFPIAASLTAALYLNAFFYQIGAVAFYGYPNITGYLSISYVLEGVTPCLMFYLFSFFLCFISGLVKNKSIVFFYILLSIPLMFFSYLGYKIYLFESYIGVSRVSEKASIFFMMVSFYGSMLGFSEIRSSRDVSVNYKVTMAALTIITMIFSGGSIGRMVSYYLSDIYKVKELNDSYLIKAYNDRLIIASCSDSNAVYSLESDFSKYHFIKLSDDKEKDSLRACLFKSSKDIIF
ncbi:hypothetical protein [Pantoea agglomerans]|uniref:hypothetical protein n=1 Tax=Enterobacter agglomerans TaxID=549 RepID=UPI00301743C6